MRRRARRARSIRLRRGPVRRIRKRFRRRIRPRTMRMRRRIRRASRGIPKYAKRELSGIILLDRVRSPTQTAAQSTALTAGTYYGMRPLVEGFLPSVAYSTLFKQWKLVKVLVAIRRRFPEPVTYQPTSEGQTVAASRLATNNIWWVPWGKFDQPAQPPRQIKSAVMLSGSWTVRKIRQRCQRFQFFQTMEDPNFLGGADGADGTEGNGLMPGNAFVAAGNTARWGVSPYWGSVPWISFGSGTLVQRLLPRLNFGFVLVENRSPVTPDALELRCQVHYRLKGRKTLGIIDDPTGPFTQASVLADGQIWIDAPKSEAPGGTIQDALLAQEEIGEPVIPDILA